MPISYFLKGRRKTLWMGTLCFLLVWLYSPFLACSRGTWRQPLLAKSFYWLLLLLGAQPMAPLRTSISLSKGKLLLQFCWSLKWENRIFLEVKEILRRGEFSKGREDQSVTVGKERGDKARGQGDSNRARGPPKSWMEKLHFLISLPGSREAVNKIRWQLLVLFYTPLGCLLDISLTLRACSNPCHKSRPGGPCWPSNLLLGYQVEGVSQKTTPERMCIDLSFKVKRGFISSTLFAKD